jgi:hypothetical protein
MNEIPDTDFLSNVHIQEGVSPAPGVLIAACTINEDHGVPKNKVGVRKRDGWIEFGLSKEAILSVDADASGAAYVMGENGSVVAFDWRASTSQAELKASRQAWPHPAVNDLGPLRRLRFLGRDVVCAGSVGQAYRVAGGQFQRFPTLAMGGEALTIEDLAGHGASDFVAVTSDGYAAHFNGRGWQVIDLPTGASLTSIDRAGENYAMAGKNGTLLLGKLAQGQWSIVPAPDPSRDYWGVAIVGRSVYAAHLGGIDMVSNGSLVPVGIAEAASLQFAVLRGAADGAWSFAGQTIGQVVGDRWRTVVRP